MPGKHSQRLQYAIAMARAEAHRVANETVTPEHMLFALSFGNGQLAKILREHGVTPEALRDNLPIWSRSGQVDVPLSQELCDLLDFASELCGSDLLKQVNPEHVLKALLREDVVFSVVPILKTLNVDLEKLRIQIETCPTDPPDTADDSTGPDEIHQPASRNSWQSAVFGEGPFDTQAVRVIKDAWINSQVLGPPRPEPKHPWQTGDSPHYSKKLGLHHLIAAFKKLSLLPDYVSEVVLTLGEQNLFELIICANVDDSIKLRNDAKSALLSARLLASATSDGLVTPLMLLYGIVTQFESILFTNADLEKLSHISQQIRQELASNSETINRIFDSKVSCGVSTANAISADLANAAGPASITIINPTHLLITQRLVRVLRFAKKEASFEHHALVRAPHLVLAILREALSSEITFVMDREFDVEKFRIVVNREYDILRRMSFESYKSPRLAPESRGLLLLARAKAHELGRPTIDLCHLALALLETQRWLRDIIDRLCRSSGAIRSRLEECTVFDQGAEYSSTIGLHVSLDEIDDQVETWAESETSETSLEDRLSRRSDIVFKHARLESRKLNQSKISVETLMLGLLYETFGPTYDVFSLLDLNLLDSRKVLAISCTRRSARPAVVITLSVNALRLMERAWEFTQLLKKNRIEPEHILLAIAEEEYGVASFVCEALAIEGRLLRAEVISALNKSKECSVPS